MNAAPRFRVGASRKAGLRVQMLPGENERDRVLTTDEESRYLKATAAAGDSILAAHARALEGIRAQLRVRYQLNRTIRFCFGT